MANPKIDNVSLLDGKVQIQYTGILKSADEVTGPYTPVANASSPYSVTPDGAKKFYVAQ